jgi:hypothetical protein
MIYDLSSFSRPYRRRKKVNFPGENARRRSADRICKLTALSEGRLSCYTLIISPIHYEGPLPPSPPLLLLSFLRTALLICSLKFNTEMIGTDTGELQRFLNKYSKKKFVSFE